MRFYRLWLVALLASVWRLSAQVSVEVALDQDQFLASETLRVAVRITNRSGQTLHLGEDGDWLTFSVEARDGFVVSKSGEIPVTGEFALDSSKMATKRVDLTPYFNLTKAGRYTVIATVRIKQWDKQYVSKPKSFDIIRGAKLWEQEFGLPLAVGANNQQPEVRKYILQQANYLKQLRLYLRLTDASEGKVFKVIAIGPIVSFARPEPQVDKFSNLHILYQTGPRAFSYTVINPDGDIIVRQTHEIANTRPRLQPGGDGDFIVVGGMRRPAPNDLPATDAATPSESDKPSKP
ncbi:MAG: hypothetical protein HY298_18205 [Verrucomicrobia bacterium]|nr:hypothetical protein [Verrucomicrobiota bacterium]